ncbi:STAS domain-containing protein [Actinoplanes sp. NPDC048967]|uniref:STAS domain-containing protein n=1 Tax=Actinoplanes sp. NPDC048967 TaxID=3155269 RepID=UPI0033D4B7A5
MSDSGQLPRRPAPDVADIPAPGDGIPAPAASAQVIAQDGSVIATVARRVRPPEPGEAGPEVVVSVQGDLDLDTAPLAQATLIQALEGAERVCLELSGVSFFGAAGVRVVIAAQLRAASLGRQLRLSGVRGITERVLVLTGVYREG